MDPLISLAFITGFTGSAHCIGMCGGLVSALSLSADGRNGGLLFHLLYNCGRTLTYGLIGLIVGWIGSALAYRQSLQDVTQWLLIGSDLLIILIGLGSAGLFTKINIMQLEFSGPVRIMTMAVRGLRRFPPALSALPLGLLFGFLPCGFLYAMALTAAQSADSLRGAGIMLAFGAGTMPALFLVGSAARWFAVQRGWMLRTAGLLVAIMGGYNLVQHIKLLS
ncbi:MAG: sulfite exporter TauE/SafE family protein [Desulfuromonadales bacterium]|nr:sulfite exporter TauE/SafE family protein [Desulfuromonadales bacterium]